MNIGLRAATVASALMLCTQPALAGVYTDDLSKCLVNSTSPADQIVLIKWIFAAMALNPSVKPFAHITEAEQKSFTTDVGNLYVRLMTEDCRKETISALKYEGSSSIEGAFNVVGQVAMRGLLSDPQVTAGMSDLGKTFDQPKMIEVLKEAGITPDSK